MDMGMLRGVITAALLVLFVALWITSWSRKRKQAFDEAARLPLAEDREPTSRKEAR